MKQTLSQTALAKRFGRPASALRAMGELVDGTNGNGERETWAEMRYGDGRLAGYELVVTTPPKPIPAEAVMARQQ